MTAKRLGFFTRMLDQTDPGNRYRLGTAQIVHAEKHGFQTAWVAQHHLIEGEGGIPSPFVLLTHIAAQTSTIRLGTGIVTLPLEEPLRTAEDAAVMDLLSGGRLELGVGSGGNPLAFAPFGRDVAERTQTYIDNLRILRSALRGDVLKSAGAPLLPNPIDLARSMRDAVKATITGEKRPPLDARLYPGRPQLLDRMWQATFSADGGHWAGKEGDGLLLSRAQPRRPDAPHASLADIQMPIVEAYMKALPAGRAPRIMGSRAVFVADSHDEAMRYAEIGLRRHSEHLRNVGHKKLSGTLEEMIAATDTHVGTPEEVIASLRADTTLEHVTELAFQVHSVDPPHELILRSIELIASTVAPALGWQKPEAAAEMALEPAA